MKEDQIEVLRQMSRKLIRELGMLQLNKSNSQETPVHWHALIEISKNPGITISQLGHLLLISNSTISRLIKTLTKEDIVDLQVGQDKREKYLYLTDKGLEQIKKIDAFSEEKIVGAFEYLTQKEITQIIQSITQYSNALEKSRILGEQVKIATLPTSRAIRKQIMNMIADIQKNEFSVPITDETNMCVLKAEESFYYSNSYNFWYATDNNGKILGSIGLSKLDDKYGEIKKCFVIKEYRGKGVAQKLMSTLLKAASKHQFEFLVLGSVDKLHGAHKFYRKYGFVSIDPHDLPDRFQKNPLDTVFLQGQVKALSIP